MILVLTINLLKCTLFFLHTKRSLHSAAQQEVIPPDQRRVQISKSHCVWCSSAGRVWCSVSSLFPILTSKCFGDASKLSEWKKSVGGGGGGGGGVGGERKMRTLSLGLFVENGLASLHTLIEPRRGDHTEMCDGPPRAQLEHCSLTKPMRTDKKNAKDEQNWHPVFCFLYLDHITHHLQQPTTSKHDPLTSRDPQHSCQPSRQSNCATQILETKISA